ncbi:MAG: cytochrome ubiquinol oxidase subunit I [Actinomycetota bacterium]|nr:cytochrome ubiquinol oxidase subunit I [Actinomycetota bacterium]
MLDLIAAGGSAFGPGSSFPVVDQDYLLEARQMQALSFAVHIPLVCFGIAFPALVVFMEWLGLRTGRPHFTVIARRWSKVMITLFAAGVVTGTLLSFELGLLWPGFMASFADVFGLAFGLEGFSFFVEAIFIAIYVYGWDRMSPRRHLLVGVPVIAAGFTGSMMVIAVNAWMNNPSGFTLAGEEVVDVRPWEALFGNGHLWPQLIHMYLAAWIVVGFLLAGVYGYRWLKGNRTTYVRTAMVVPLAVACVAAPVQILIGDWAARTVARDQPIKLASFEGLYRTTEGAPETILGWYTKDNTIEYGIEIPKLLSLLAYHDPDATVQGLETVPEKDRPPINVVRIAFQTMVAIGTSLAALALWMLWVWWRRREIPRSRWFYRAVIAAGPAAVVALIAGWVTTEVGRQPWVVYGVMRTEEAVTGADGIIFGYGVLVGIYVLLALTVFMVLRGLARKPLPSEAGEEGPDGAR